MLAESVPQIVWVAGADGSHIFLSGQWTAYTGRPANESSGMGWLHSAHPDGPRSGRRSKPCAARESGRTPPSVRSSVRLQSVADGESTAGGWCARCLDARRRRQGTVVKWIGTCTDIRPPEDCTARDPAHESRLRTAPRLESDRRCSPPAAVGPADLGSRTTARATITARQPARLRTVRRLRSAPRCIGRNWPAAEIVPRTAVERKLPCQRTAFDVDPVGRRDARQRESRRATAREQRTDRAGTDTVLRAASETGEPTGARQAIGAGRQRPHARPRSSAARAS